MSKSRLSVMVTVPRAGGVTLARIMDVSLARLAAFLLALTCLLPAPAIAQDRAARFGDENISVELFADGAPAPGEEWLLALRFTPSSEEWHGYWSNPGDAGQGMDLQLDLPDGWQVGKPLYPVPQTLLIGGLMNHIFEGEYVVLLPVTPGPDAAVMNLAPVTGFVEYLACTDRICVPQDAALRARSGGNFDEWRGRIAPMLDSEAGFEISGERLRIGIPLPASMGLGELHLFLENPSLGNGLRPEYAAVQTWIRDGNLLVAELPLERTKGDSADTPDRIEGILALGDGEGVRFMATPADVPLEGVKAFRGPRETPPFGLLVIAALVGGFLLNIMPCVFPILSLKALALAKAGGDEGAARRDALAYTAGVVLACAGLGALILLLRSAGQQVGWAFQLQEPAIVASLFALAALITANFLGLFAIPGLAISGGKPSSGGSFATGLLAAFVATPCTGPFMALALGAALVLRPIEGFAIFTALGVGLALPFLLVGFVPAFRKRLPKPGAWMERFRRWMALPMGLTLLALGWLLWRIGGGQFLLSATGVAAGLVYFAGMISPEGQASGKSRMLPALIGLAMAAVSAIGMVRTYDPPVADSAQSILDPQEFSAANLAAARASGQTVFVWFTADWCITCKVNESVGIEREETRAAFEEAGVIAMRGDWTRRDDDIAAFLSQQGAAGVPLYLWYPAGGDARQLPQVLTPDLLPELARQEAARSR
ncbi:thiol:disulfide interchange protein [Erythrobacter aquimaris]|uniref:Thiol:disulfide interchange protein n=1 Tax=Qipengyuania aquimaris TaxID=255984 RepID=A0A6I4TLQ4_9SPHN|nr:protein-disulfide reductase DsbD [Qipengyuania aquimaris]MXO96199.1 thiol:disulfide interchange protein [Qipengyuania aquimaris]